MSIEAKGTITFQSFGLGVWALAAKDVTYELFEPPTELQQEGLSVNITGIIRDDIMTVAMIGPVLEVQSFEISGS
ncbi:hypothetical protein [Acaryochloris marina]|uniref:Uncharacterized protein n=1 Tax=Acaryochloris marina (strain MBIC 11017) TaxID=329726 RepID=B0CD87_ACAM1|nr:hypothetical protein [Acaryochloris marina]ABW25678.1 conserved hypothetical protein [Acaryochloris marina MBIC11017]BDM80551.1 hypothetical protein AM10699_34190 [Acaryochloris marina MBIC10699]